MKLTDEQLDRIDRTMKTALAGLHLDRPAISMLAAGMRELAQMEIYKYDDWPEETTTASVLVTTANELEAK